MKENVNVIGKLNECILKGKEAALATLISSQGSSPRGTAAKMLIYPGGKTEGTVGGGAIEALTIKKALECLKKGESGKFRFTLKKGGNTGMICGGEAEVFIEVYSRPLRVFICGSGHVAYEIARVLDAAGYPYEIADDRSDFLNEKRYPNAAALHLDLPHRALKKAGIGEKDYVVIVTRGHALDKECLAAAVRTKAKYIGMIGSASKVKATLEKVKTRAYDPGKDRRIYSPVGLDIGGETPGEIAVSVVSEIMKVHYSASGRHMREER